MAANGNTFQTANDKKNITIYNTQNFILRPTKEILEGSPPSDAVNMNHATEVYQYIRLNVRNLHYLEEAVKTDKYGNDKSEIEEMINTLRDNVDLLGERVNIYNQSIQEELDNMEIPMVRSLCKDPDTGYSIIDKIMVVYGDPMYDSYYGKLIRLTMIALEKFLNTNDSNNLNVMIGECEKYLDAITGVIPMINSSQKLLLHRVQESLINLLQICHTVNDSSND